MREGQRGHQEQRYGSHQEGNRRLQKPLYELSAAAYQQAQAAGAQGAQAGTESAQGAQQQKKDDDDVVDADYTEVKDDKK